MIGCFYRTGVPYIRLLPLVRRPGFVSGKTVRRRKMNKKIFSVLLTAVLLASCLGMAQASAEDPLNYTLFAIKQ